jgi:exodeoxyribonuclease VII large subunit
VIGAGIKLLVRARPVFKAQYGFSLEIDAIDPDYTLGDLEAKKREIRMRLQNEGLFERNRLLSSPFDFHLVLVVSPAEAAGLGDFRKEADRMGRHGVCRFVYAHSRFQGEGAAQEIVATATQALRELGGTGVPDAIALIRGGGAVNDLAWLNDYALARWVCDQPIPVLTGIGHERDSTVIDEVANTRFDTPSKVVSGIEQQIVARARETQRAWDLVASAAQRSLQAVRIDVASMEAQIRGDARGHIAEARQVSAGVVHEIAVGSVRRVHDRAGQTAAMMTEIREGTNRDIAAARQAVPAMLAAIRSDALSNLQEARTGVGTDRSEILARAAEGVRTASVASRTRMHDVAERAANSVRTAREGAQALIREVAGQGPQKTLGRGFAIVRNAEGSAITSADTARDSAELNIEFRDGRVIALPDSDQKRRTT